MRLIFILLLFTSCAGVEQRISANKFYPKDLILKVNGQKGVGTLVVPQSSKYKIEVESAGDLNLFWYTSCHQSRPAQDAWDKGFFIDDKKEASFTYVPSETRDKSIFSEQRDCPLRMMASSEKGVHAWGLIDFLDSEHNLPAKVLCNGEKYDSRGVTICQSLGGLYQVIQFTVEAYTVAPENPVCPELKAADNKNYVYKMPFGECTYFFKTKYGQVHRLTTYGWQEPLVRGN